MLLYVAVIIGVTVATHFCAGRAMSADLVAGHQQDPSCPCGMEGPVDDCCKTVVSTFRVSDDHTMVSPWVAPVFAGTFLPQPIVFSAPVEPFVFTASAFHPPGISQRILICSLLV
jgi:hypothetical protein